MIPLTEEQKGVLAKAISTHGVEFQTEKAIEECAELICAIKHFEDLRADHSAVITEIADVLIMCEQLSMIFGKDKVKQEIDRKINRLDKRLCE